MVGKVLSLFALVSLTACSSREKEAEVSSTRVNAVLAPKKDTDKLLESFCDVRPPKGTKAFKEPPLEGSLLPRPEGWRWINVWATWCKPCVEELPLLSRFQERLKKDATNFRLEFVSADSSMAEVRAFIESRPLLSGTTRLRDAGSLSSWLESLGLDAGATIPVHVFIDSIGNVRCLRTASVSEDDYEAVQALLSGT